MHVYFTITEKTKKPIKLQGISKSNSQITSFYLQDILQETLIIKNKIQVPYLGCQAPCILASVSFFHIKS